MLVTLAEMKTYVGITAGTTYDAFLTSQLTIASDAVEAYCRRVFASTTYTETFYGVDFAKSKTLNTFMYPVISLTSITEDGQLVDAADYRIHSPSGLITKTSGLFFSGQEETVVVYTAGYPAVPEAVKGVVYSVVSERYNKKVSGVELNFGSDVQRVSIPGTISVDFDYSLQNNQRETKFGTILGNHLNTLDYYRSNRAVIADDRLAYYVAT